MQVQGQKVGATFSTFFHLFEFALDTSITCFRAAGSGYGVWCLGFRVWGLEFGVYGLGLRVENLGLGVEELILTDFGLQGPRLRVFRQNAVHFHVSGPRIAVDSPSEHVNPPSG